MPLLFCLVARGTTTLARYATCTGNFQEVADQVLTTVDANAADTKMTYIHTGYMFHYLTEQGCTYLCVSDDKFDRATAFMFLTEVKKQFTKTFRNRVNPGSTVVPFAMQSEFSRVIACEMRHYSDNNASTTTTSSHQSDDKLNQAQEQIDSVKAIMIDNIEAITQRGERLELLVDKTDELNATSVTFKKTSHNLARAMWMKNMKMIVAIVLLVVIPILIIVFAYCGTDWANCGKS